MPTDKPLNTPASPSLPSPTAEAPAVLEQPPTETPSIAEKGSFKEPSEVAETLLTAEKQSSRRRKIANRPETRSSKRAVLVSPTSKTVFESLSTVCSATP